MTHTPFDPIAHIEYAEDFGHYISNIPKYISSPLNTRNLQSDIKFAKANNLKISLRGFGHSTGGQPLSDGGLVIDMKSLCEIGDIAHHDGYSSIVIQAGASWFDVFKKCLPLGYTPPTYSDWLYLSAGGTVSSGGVGQCSFRKGFQIDNVLSMNVIDARGELVHCSSTQNTDLFNVIRGGFGQYGVIVDIEMRLEKAPEHVLVHKLVYDNHDDFLNDQTYLTEQSDIDAIQSHIVSNDINSISKRVGRSLVDSEIALVESKPKNPWAFVLEVTQYLHNTQQKKDSRWLSHCKHYLHTSAQATFSSHVTRVPPILQTEGSGSSKHHHCCLFIPRSTASEFLKQSLSLSTHSNMGGGAVLVIPLKRDKTVAPYTPLPNEDDFFMVCFLRRLAPELSSLEELEQINHQTYELAMNLGGKVYPCGSGELFNDPKFWEKHFGPEDYLKLSEHKYHYDPDGLFSNFFSFSYAAG